MYYIILFIFLAAVSYHVLSYSYHLIKKEKNKLAAFGVILIAVANIAAPLILLIYRY